MLFPTYHEREVLAIARRLHQDNPNAFDQADYQAIIERRVGDLSEDARVAIVQADLRTSRTKAEKRWDPNPRLDKGKPPF
jgi:hypothetical protein